MRLVSFIWFRLCVTSCQEEASAYRQIHTVTCPLDVNGKGIRGVGGAADKEADTVHTINIISQRLYFVARCLRSYVGNVSGSKFVFLLPAGEWRRQNSQFGPGYSTWHSVCSGSTRLDVYWRPCVKYVARCSWNALTLALSESDSSENPELFHIHQTKQWNLNCILRSNLHYINITINWPGKN
jgi:hypothetical protein